VKPDHDGLFRELEPPPGGAERFRQRLAEPDDWSRAPIGRLLAAGGGIAAVVIVALLALWQTELPEDVVEGELEPQTTEVFQSKDFDRLLGRPMEPLETSVVINDVPVDLTEVLGARPGVRIYEIQTN
jgi:hypothetical protein